ncbi:MAG: hypothetical protein CL561_07925 [Alphaproteobacteria bacterium]|nr:hypothetical protein [Alphaproteobacteria bacterium]
MSNQLYKNKAARILQRAETKMHAFIQRACNNITAGSQADKVAILQDIESIFDNWKDCTIPRLYSSTDGAQMLVMPYSDLKFDNKNRDKKQNARYRTSSVRLFMTTPLQQLSIYRVSFINSGKTALENVMDYYLDTLHSDEDFPALPRFGKRIFNYNHLEIKNIFSYREDRYQGKIGPSAYILAQLKHIADKYKFPLTITRNDINDLIKSVEDMWLDAASYQALSIVNRDALRAILRNSEPSYRDYQWTMSGATAEIIDRRIGAFQTYPGLTPLFSLKYVGEWDYNSLHRREDSQYKTQEALTHMVDSGASVPATLKAIFAKEAIDIPKKYLAPYHGANDQNFGKEGLDILTEHLDVLPSFNREEYPTHKDAWVTFQERCKHLKYKEEKTKLPFNALLQHERIAPKAKIEWAHVGDFVNALRRSIVLPAVVQIAKQEYGITGDVLNLASKISYDKTLIRGFMQPFTVSQAVNGSKDWHDRLSTVNARIKSIAVENNLSWPALCENFDTPQGVNIRPLTTKIELQEEGTRMDHCVGGYASNCILDGAHIFHLSYTDEQGHTHNSTLQLVENKTDKQVTVINRQNKAQSNKKPHKKNADAADWFVENLNNGKIPVDWTALYAQRDEVAAIYKQNRIIHEIGFDPEQESYCAEAYDIMRDFLPPKLAKLDYAQYLLKGQGVALIHKAIEKAINKPDKLTPTPM